MEKQMLFKRSLFLKEIYIMFTRPDLIPPEKVLNVIVKGPCYNEQRARDLFSTDDKICIFNENQVDIFDLLVLVGAFESKGQAKKNWGGIKEIPNGWTEIKTSRKKPRFIFIQRSFCYGKSCTCRVTK